MPLGKSKFTSSAILVGLNSLKSRKKHKGGLNVFNQLVDITKTLTSKEFFVPGLLVYLNKLMSNDIKNYKSKSKKGGNIISNLLQTIVSLVIPFGGINQAVTTGSLIAISSYDYNLISSKKSSNKSSNKSSKKSSNKSSKKYSNKSSKKYSKKSSKK